MPHLRCRTPHYTRYTRVFECHGVMPFTNNTHQNRIFTYQVLTRFEGDLGFGKLYEHSERASRLGR